jgi:hypothetical protein
VLGRARVAALGWNSRAAEEFVQWPAYCLFSVATIGFLCASPPRDVLGAFPPESILGGFPPICKVGAFPPNSDQPQRTTTSQAHFHPNRNR